MGYYERGNWSLEWLRRYNVAAALSSGTCAPCVSTGNMHVPVRVPVLVENYFNLNLNSNLNGYSTLYYIYRYPGTVFVILICNLREYGSASATARYYKFNFGIYIIHCILSCTVHFCVPYTTRNALS